MKINFTKKQYQDLLKLVFLGGWTINAHETSGRPDPIGEIEQHLLSFYKDFGLESEVEYEEQDKKYYYTHGFEDDSDVMEIIEQYDDDSFWDNLIHRLATRDFTINYGEERIKTMEMEEYLKLEEPFVMKYANEFTENGLDNMILRNDAAKAPFKIV